MNQESKGFTLIELLVVIAIIGILSSVVLSAVDVTQTKASDAKIKSMLSSTRAEAIIYNSTNSSYDGVCATSGTNTIGTLVTAAEEVYDGSASSYTDDLASTWQTGQCHDSSSAWAAIVPLKDSTSASPQMWCVDSTGVSAQVTSRLLAHVFVCPSS